MTETRHKVWSSYVSEEDQARYERIGFGGSTGLGDRPALVVIDVQKRTVLPEYEASCAPYAHEALPTIARLLDAFRSRSLPTVIAYVAPKTEQDSSRFAAKMPKLQAVDQTGYEFPDEVAPTAEDILLPKRHPSVFFGTAMMSYLVDRKVDSLVIAGATTSGCVRATAIDAFSYSLKVVVPHDAVFDRVETSHYVNLFDIAHKYGDVLDTDETISLLKEGQE
ncbi:MAG: isochorismatase family protein [Acidimicrobiia bacterium]|nr:isochorismatase family protein [Acidimicrobiia bacterium]